MFVCMVLFTATNSLRGASFRVGKRLWPLGEDPYGNQFERDKLFKMVNLVVRVLSWNSDFLLTLEWIWSAFQHKNAKPTTSSIGKNANNSIHLWVIIRISFWTL